MNKNLAAGIEIGQAVGIGPKVMVLTSAHTLPEAGTPVEPESEMVPILHRPLRFAPVQLLDGCDLGVGAIILPGVTVGAYAQVGAGAVVTVDVPPRAIVVGNPARIVRFY